MHIGGKGEWLLLDRIVLGPATADLLRKNISREGGHNIVQEQTTGAGSKKDDDGARREDHYVIDRLVDHSNENGE